MENKTTGCPQIFRFKQFEVDQSACAMKINTDGVLLGAMAGTYLSGGGPGLKMLDIGTGTGVIGLMLAQRYTRAEIDAIEIDGPAALQARKNFQDSPFASRLNVYHTALQDFLPEGLYGTREDSCGIYDLIVSNPPFFLNSLKNPDPRKELARHTNQEFFDQLLHCSTQWLTPQGCIQLILPPGLSTAIEKQAIENYGFYPAGKTEIYSFSTDNRPIRILLSLSKNQLLYQVSLSKKIMIYARPGEYSTAYRQLLSDFFLAF